MKTQRVKSGITLIALVITIIVLLILAGVALATLTGQGNIIGNAENAVGKYNNSVASEQQLLNEIEKYFQNYLESGNKEPIETEILDSSDIANNPEEHYGGYVTNYTPKNGDTSVQWRIFHADESNIYLIASDYVHYDYIPVGRNGTELIDSGNGYSISTDTVGQDYKGSEDITDIRLVKWLSYLSSYPSSGERISGAKKTAYVLDLAAWSKKYGDDKFAEYAVGGPTLDMWCASYKATHPDKYVKYMIYGETGYYMGWYDGTAEVDYVYTVSEVKDFDNLYYITDGTSKASRMWLASPTSYDYYGTLTCLNFEGAFEVRSSYRNYAGFRPIVCLNAAVKLEMISNSEYRIVE